MHHIKGLGVFEMKRIVIVILVITVMALFCGGTVADANGDENYNDHSEEVSQGPGEAPDEGMAREELRTRFKDS